MMDNLVEKCRLTKEEWLNIWYSGDDERHLEFYHTYGVSTCLRQIKKAIPIIQKDWKERLKGKIKRIENPYADIEFLTKVVMAKGIGFSEARQAILQLIEEE